MDHNSGDLVILKAGGPIMVIHEGKDDKGAYCCRWFNGNEFQEVWFLPETLLAVDPGPTKFTLSAEPYQGD